MIAKKTLIAIGLFTANLSVFATSIHTTDVTTYTRGVYACVTIRIGALKNEKLCSLKKQAELGCKLFSNNEVDFLDGRDVQQIFGPDYSCVSILYYGIKHNINDTFKINWDKTEKAYIASEPQESHVTLY